MCRCDGRFISLMFLSVLLTGCSSSSPPVDELSSFMRSQQEKIRSPFKLENIEITKAESSGKPPTWTLEVKVTGKSTIDLFDPLTIEAAQTWYKRDPKPYEDALQRTNRLREPERSATLTKRPKSERIGPIFRKSLIAGKAFTFTTQVTAEQKSSGWEFFSDPQSIQLDGVTFQSTGRSDMPKDAIVIDGEQDNVLTKIFKERTQFADAVTQAESDVTARLAREHQELVAASGLWNSWLTSVPTRTGAPLRVRVQFIPKTADGRVAVMVSDADHIEQRSIWTGQLELPAEPQGDDERLKSRPSPDGWTIHLTPVVQDECLPLTDRPSSIRLAPEPDGRLRWLGKPGPLVLTRDGNPPTIPSHDALVRKINEGSAPGRVWEGTLQYPGQAAERVRLTIAERRSDGQYLRAVVELANDPFVVAIFEGTVSTTVENAYGFPIRLTRKTSAGPGTFLARSLPLFRQGTVGAIRVNLADTLDGKSDLLGSNLQLNRVKPLSASKPHRELWAQALEAGAQWSGTMAFGTQAASRVTFTVAEIRDEGKYVRLTAVDPEMRNRFRIFEGSFNPSDSTVDGYALTVSGVFPTPLPTQHDSGSNRDIFGTGKQQPQLFRLLPDGQTIVGISFAGQLEKLTLTRDEKPAPLSLLRDDMSKVWRQACVKGSRWRGTLNNLGVKQSTEVELQITSDVDAEGQFSTFITVPGQAKSRIEFSGVLRLDTDASSNGYAMDLIKKSPGATSKSPILGNVTIGNHVFFRLSPDGNELIGYAHRAVNEVGPEVLELKRLE